MREQPTPNEVSELTKVYEDSLDLTLRLHDDVMKNSFRNERDAAWNLVITDLQNRRAELLVQIEPGLKGAAALERAVLDVTAAFAVVDGKPLSAWQVADARVTESLKALFPLAQKFGYRPSIDDNLLVLETGEIKISLGFMDRGDPGLGPSGAVKFVDATAPGSELVQYSGEWTGVACDPDLQRHIDRAIAIFG